MTTIVASMRYVGIPYRDRGRDDRTGLDCWGLVMLWYRLERGIELPDYAETYASADDMHGSALALAGNAGDGRWQELEPGAAARGDVIVLRIVGHECHTGVVVGRGMMLHTLHGHQSIIERYDALVWRNRVAGFYRWQGATA